MRKTPKIYFLITFCFVCCCFILAGESAYGQTKQTAAKSNSDLDAYMRLIRRVDPYAVVTSWFWDWRGVSKYRSNPGYHLGYDIGLNKGEAVPSGWDGIVTAINPWYEGEWGITVLTNYGYSVTYGHLRPIVCAGQRITAGTPVGTVSVDHVDIKITDSKGNYVDFGKTNGLLPLDPNSVYLTAKNYSLISKLDRDALIKTRQKELSLLRGTAFLVKDYYDLEKELLSDSKKQTEKMRKLYQEELISKSELSGYEDNFSRQQLKVSNLKQRLDNQTKRIELIQKELALYGGKELPAQKQKVKTNAALEEAKKKSERYEKLYAEGAVSKMEMEKTAIEYKRLRLKLLLEDN